MGWLGNLLGPRRGTGRPQKAFRRRSLGTLARVGLHSGVSHLKTGAASTWRRGRTKVRAAERRRYGHPLSGRERLQAGYHRVKNAYEDYQRPRTHGQIGHYRNWGTPRHDQAVANWKLERFERDNPQLFKKKVRKSTSIRKPFAQSTRKTVTRYSSRNRYARRSRRRSIGVW